MKPRRLFYVLAHPVVYAMVPLKTWAFTTRSSVLRGLILEATSAVDFLLVGLLVQNPALTLTAKAFGGNFIFGKALMETSHRRAAAALVEPQLRGRLFMGLPIVGFDPSAFMSNAGPINVSQPARGVLRKYLDAHIVSDAVRHPDIADIEERCADILATWLADSKRDTFRAVRGTITRMLALLLADVDLPEDEAYTITARYLRRFAELTAFSYYAPVLLGLLNTHEKIRQEVYLPLRRHGINTLVVDMILFAGMFSVGTIVMKCIDYTREHDIDYGALSTAERMAFVVESLRLFPTVSTVHRIVEEPEAFTIRGRTVTAKPGSEIAYPFVCIHRDESVFSEPETFRIDRSPTEVAEVLSWSRGPTMCPVRDLSVVVTTAILNALSDVADLRTVRIANIEV